MTKQDLSWWDHYSDQPYKLSATDKPRTGAANIKEYLAILATAVVMAPQVLVRFARLGPVNQRAEAASFVGLSVSPDERFNNAIEEMVEELGVQELLLRVPSWDINNIDQYVRFAERFNGRRFLINILQNRDSVLNPDGWRRALNEIFNAFSHTSVYFQIGNAINRSKWGCMHSEEYLKLLEIAEEVRAGNSNVKLVGSSVIDFEPLVTLRTLRNSRTYNLDAVSSLLYVNRRGSPYGRQYKVFDLYQKLRLIYAIVLTGNRNAPRLWITEVNWPLLDTKPYTPNSGHPKRTVDEDTQAVYLRDYYKIAYGTGWVERVYWWQLINPGYGLVDHRDGKLRKHPSFCAFKSLLNSDWLTSN